jgi:hypothetical protein
MEALMRRFLSICILLNILLITNLFSANYALIMSGGCNSTLSREMFEEAFLFAEAIKKRGWEVTVLQSNEVLREQHNRTPRYNFSRYKVMDFTRKNIESSLDEIQKKVKNNDQVLINIITHGLPTKGPSGHIICTMDDKKDKNHHFDLKNLKEMGLDKISAKGANIAILDNSCYGGETISTFENEACVISTQTPKFPSFAIPHTGRYDEKYQGVFGITTLVKNELSKSGKKLSMEDYYIRSLVDYPSWTALQDPTILSVFPSMSGDEKGNALSDFASIYSFIKSGNFDYDIDFNNYTDSELCQNITSSAEQNKQKNTTSPSLEQCSIQLKNFSEEKYNIFQKIRNFVSSEKRKGPKLKNKELVSTKAELNDLIEKLKNTYDQISLKEANLIKLDNDFFQTLEQYLKNNQVNAVLCSDKSKIQKLLSSSDEQIANFKTAPSYKDAFEILQKNNCKITEDISVVECPCCEMGQHYISPSAWITVWDKSPFISLNKDIGDLEFFFNLDSNNKTRMLTDAAEKLKLNNNINIKNKAHACKTDFDSRIELKEKIRKDLERFNMLFNKLKALDYIQRTSKIKPSKDIKRCRDFKI